MLRRFEDASGLAVACIREVFGGEWRLVVSHVDGSPLSDRLFSREFDAEACLRRCWPSMREVA